MPHIPYDTTEPLMPLTNLVMDATEIKRKGELVKLEFNLIDKFVLVSVTVHHFAKKADDTYGESLNHRVASYPRNFKADNSTICDAATGLPICPREDQQKEEQEVVTELVSGAEVTRPGKLFGVDWKYQYDYYKWKADTQQVVTMQEIRNTVLYADQVENRV